MAQRHGTRVRALKPWPEGVKVIAFLISLSASMPSPTDVGVEAHADPGHLERFLVDYEDKFGGGGATSKSSSRDIVSSI